MKKFILGLSVGLLISLPLFALASVNLADRLSGKILLQVEDNGEAWYVNPENKQRYFLGRPEDAFQVMRTLGLGISNDNLNQISIAQISSIPEKKEVSYKTIKTFSGTGNFNSSDFAISGEKFKVIWTHTGSSNFTMVANDEENPISTCWMGNVIGNWSAYDVCPHGEGNFNISVITDGSWTAEVQDYK